MLTDKSARTELPTRIKLNDSCVADIVIYSTERLNWWCITCLQDTVIYAPA